MRNLESEGETIVINVIPQCNEAVSFLLVGTKAMTGSWSMSQNQRNCPKWSGLTPDSMIRII